MASRLQAYKRPDSTRPGAFEFRDVTIVDDDSGKTILAIEVSGKRGVGCCKSMPGAVSFSSSCGRTHKARSRMQ